MSEAITSSNPAWRLDWLTPIRCRLILLMVLVVGFVGHLAYLHHCPIDLAGDEAQYWDWSRNLDWSYYSKGPAIAYIIRASCSIFGDTMPAVRYPALVFAALTSLTIYLVTRKLFGCDRLALGAALLLQVLPMFIAGAVLMTIDPPMFFCWGLATYFAAVAIFDEKPTMWIAVGVAIGVGFLAKYAAFLWFVGLFGFLLFSNRGRAWRAALIALPIAAVFALPVIVWNYRNNWVSYRHVATQTGVNHGQFAFAGVAEMLGGQLGAAGPTLAILMIAGVVYAIRRREDPNRPRLLFLTWIGVAYFGINFVASFRTKVQPNWPAPAYFTLIILAAYFISTRLRSLAKWKPWRGWFWATIVIGIILIPIVRDTAIIYPLLKPLAERSHKTMDDFDPMARVRGWSELGAFVSTELATLGPGAFVLCDDYQQTAETAFYVRGQPRTYCAGSYFGKRLSQYDLWQKNVLELGSPLVGRDAIYVGKGGRLPPEVAAAFDSVERYPELPVIRGGVTVRTFKVWRCKGFRGLTRAAAEQDF